MKVPVFIFTRDRLTCLRALVEWLERCDEVSEILFVDNQSTYPPLLDYLSSTSHSIVQTNSNVAGQAFNIAHAIAKSGRYGPNPQYVLTDPDVVPTVECPHDLISHLAAGLERYPHVSKAGVALELLDIPETYQRRDHVWRHEYDHWIRPIEEEWFDAGVDTTFALYRADRCNSNSIRTNYPYTAHHTTWYLNLDNLSDEEKWYLDRNVFGGTWYVFPPFVISPMEDAERLKILRDLQRRWSAGRYHRWNDYA